MSHRRPAAGRPIGDVRQLSEDVHIWKIRVREGQEHNGKKRRTYAVRWIVDGKEQHETFASRALADAYRAKLLTYQQRGAAFDKVSGLPEPMLRVRLHCPWYQHACKYVDMKWPNMAPKSRTGIADTLATVTPALLSTDRGAPPVSELRAALYGWAFVAPARESKDPPKEHAAAIRWLERHTVALADLEDPVRGADLVRRALDALARRLDGKPAAPATVSRKRAVFHNALEYAIELGLLTTNPIDRVKWRAPQAVETVDRRVVVNRRQAQALLAAVGEQPGVAQRLVAFFGCMYYAALRPGEALALREENLASLPKEGWGEFLLSNSSPRSGKAWTNNGRSRERRGLKHRPDDETRSVPVHPALVALLRKHIAEFGVAPDGRVFVGPRGGTIGDSTYLAVWHKARALALTPAEFRSPLAGVPYGLRHAAVSTWLNAGTHPPQVAEWAGHSLAVLLRVYAKCISGQEDAARRRIEEAMRDEEEAMRDEEEDGDQ